MITRNVEIIDIDPVHWRNLHSLLDITRIADTRPLRPKILSIVHQGGKILRTHIPAGCQVPALEHIDDPQEMARKLYYDVQFGALDQVQILEVQSLGLFSDQVQKLDWRQALDMDDFLLRAFHQTELDPAGLSFFPAFSWAWNGLPLEKVREWLTQGPSPSAYFFGVIRDSAPWTSLILRVEERKLRLITTMEHLAKYNLPADRFPSRPQDLKTICEAITKHVAPVRAAMVCDYFFLTRLLATVDKRKALADELDTSDPATTKEIAAIGLLD
jgi:hypothetical protein